MLRTTRYFDCVVESVLEELDEGWLELDEESLLEPAPAEPLGELLDGAALEEDEEPPLALSFFWTSIEVDEELEPEGVEGEAVVPEAELEDEGAVLGELVAPEPDGLVVEDDEVEPAGARDAPLSVLLQPAIIAPPNAREIARARVETFMWPPWLGYGKEAARIGPRILRSNPAA